MFVATKLKIKITQKRLKTFFEAFWIDLALKLSKTSFNHFFKKKKFSKKSNILKKQLKHKSTNISIEKSQNKFENSFGKNRFHLIKKRL